MPPKPKFTKEEIITATLELVRERYVCIDVHSLFCLKCKKEVIINVRQLWIFIVNEEEKSAQKVVMKNELL